MMLFKNKIHASKLIVLMCTYGYWIIWNQVLALVFTPSWSKDVTAPYCISVTPLPTYFPLPSLPYWSTLLLYLTFMQACCLVLALLFIILCPIKNFIWVEREVCAYFLVTNINYASTLRRCGFKNFCLNQILFVHKFMVHNLCS